MGTALGWSTVTTIALAIVLAFFFGYGLTMLPLLRSSMALGAALPLAFALAVAFVAAFPVNRYLISRGKGHAVVHKHHEH